MKSPVIAKIVVCALCLGLVTSSQAAIVGVNALHIDSITIDVSSALFTTVTDTTSYLVLGRLIMLLTLMERPRVRERWILRLVL